jgi:hypothetical protein
MIELDRKPIIFEIKDFNISESISEDVKISKHRKARMQRAKARYKKRKKRRKRR